MMIISIEPKNVGAYIPYFMDNPMINIGGCCDVRIHV